MNSIYLEMLGWNFAHSGVKNASTFDREMSTAIEQKIGIALTLPRFKTLMLYINELEAALTSAVNGEKIVYEKHIGGNLYVYVKSPFECVQIRQKYIKDRELRYSTYKGISLKRDQFTSFTLLTEVMESFHPQIAEAVP